MGMRVKTAIHSNQRAKQNTVSAGMIKSPTKALRSTGEDPHLAVDAAALAYLGLRRVDDRRHVAGHRPAGIAIALVDHRHALDAAVVDHAAALSVARVPARGVGTLELLQGRRLVLRLLLQAVLLLHRRQQPHLRVPGVLVPAVRRAPHLARGRHGPRGRCRALLGGRCCGGSEGPSLPQRLRGVRRMAGER